MEWITESLRPLAEPLEALTIDPRNARQHDEANLHAIEASLGKYGQLSPIVCNRKTGQIVAGNGRYLAAQQLGWTHMAVVWVEQDAAAQVGFSLADNRTAELAAWDDAMLAELLDEVKATDMDLYDALLLAEMNRDDSQNEETQADAGEQMGDFEYRIIVECKNEHDQAILLKDFEERGLKCRVLIS